MKPVADALNRRPASHKRLAQSESVFQLEKNLSTLKRQFLDLEVKLRQPKSVTFQPRAPEPRSVLYELNARLAREKENMEKKAISTLCENAKLEEKVSEAKLRNSALNRELELEQTVNQRIAHENLEMKQSLEAAERENDLLASRLDALKADVQFIEEVEVQKVSQLLVARQDLLRAQEDNAALREKVQRLEKDLVAARVGLDQLARERSELQDRQAVLELRAAEKEKQAGTLAAETERLEKQLALSRHNHEVTQRHHAVLEAEKGDLLAQLTKAYRGETELLGEVAVLKARVALLEQKNDEYVDRLWRLTK